MPLHISKKLGTIKRTVRAYKSWPLMVRSSLPRFRMNGPAVVTLRNGVSYDVESWSDLHVMREVWTHGHYAPMMKEIKKGSTVIDIGAHIGIFSIAAARYAPDVKVFAFEPLPDNFMRLQKNIARNDLQGQVLAINQAVAGVRGTMDLYMMPERFSPSKFPLHDNKGKVSVTCVTLQDIFNTYHIDRCDFLKIDVEGAEWEILSAVPPDVFAKITSITLETHDHLIESVKGNAQKIVAKLEENGFVVTPSHDDTHMLFARRSKA